ncbi:hypothetical protein ACQ7DA_07230 [Zafaria sp. J156]|uniref:hypothetical protein n=1 Tax=Zafaria sp. J156 TaxID=3116490 RepID=UPI003D35F93D
MRILSAVVALLLGAAALLVGIGQKTFWAPPEIATATLSAPLQDAPLTVIEPAVGEVHADAVDITIESSGEFTAALGRSGDVEAWVGDARHNVVSGVDAEEWILNAEYVDGEAEVPNPAGSDLWVATETADGQLVHRWTEPAEGDWSLLLSADGTEPAPATITVTWPNDASTPFAVPAIIAGALLIVLGLALAVRAGRGGRGRGGPARATAPTGQGGAPQRAGAATTAQTERTSAAAPARPVRRLAAVAAAALMALLPAAPASATPSPSEAASESAPASEGADPSEPTDGDASPEGTTPADPGSEPAVPAVLLETQLERILESVEGAAATGDKSQDSKDLSGRFAGRALELRKTNYEHRSDGVDIAAPVPVAAGPVLSAAVTTSTDWPRTVTVVTQGQDATVPQVLTLRQESPRENYKVVSAVSMLPGSEFPGIAVGDPSIATLPLDAAGLVMTPAQTADRIARVLDNAENQHAPSFAKSVFIDATHLAQTEVAEDNDDARITYARSVDRDSITASSTPDGGAIVSVYVTSTMTAEPKEDGGTVSLDEASAKLAGASSTKDQAVITYGESLVMYVPAEGSDEQVRLIGGDVVQLGAEVGS